MWGLGRYVVGAAIVVLLACAAIAAEVLAHPDGCHRSAINWIPQSLTRPRRIRGPLPSVAGPPRPVPR
jgi:hypothetical protein